MNPLDPSTWGITHSNNTRGIDVDRYRQSILEEHARREHAQRMEVARRARLAGVVDADLIDKFSDDSQALNAQLIREISAFRKVMGVENK